MNSAPGQIALGRAIRAATMSAAVSAALVLAVGLIAAGALRMAEGSGEAGQAALLPGVTLLGVGQLAALVMTALSVWVLAALLRGNSPDPAHTISRLSTVLGVCIRALLTLCVLGVLGWLAWRPTAVVPALLGAAVSAQVAVATGALRSTVLAPASR